MQQRLRPEPVRVPGSIDYRRWRDRMEAIDQVLGASGVEVRFVQSFVQKELAKLKAEADKKANAGKKAGADKKGDPTWRPSTAQQEKLQARASLALRTTLARTLRGVSHRAFAAALADSGVLQQFCRIDVLVGAKIPGKSELQRNEKLVEDSEVREAVMTLLKSVSDPEMARAMEMEALDLDTQFMDSTCVELNIHYPTDWVLLRDAVRTLLKAVALVRKNGLKNRMEDPGHYQREMNKLAMEMGRQSRSRGGKKARKKTLRRMKTLARRVGEHALRHRDLLSDKWAETELSRARANNITDRIDVMLERLPHAIKQAHERIIGERQVRNAEKILSLYEGHAAVHVRGKAGAEVEFGSQLLLSESWDGLIVDWELVCGNPRHDQVLLERSLDRSAAAGLEVGCAVADRGFDSQRSRTRLEADGIENGVARRNPKSMAEKMAEPEFRRRQRRRAQTEGRIAIFKHVHLDVPLRSKGHRSQSQQVAWAVLAHNLWLVAGKARVAAGAAAGGGSPNKR